jgi:hypothetical protein
MVNRAARAWGMYAIPPKMPLTHGNNRAARARGMYAAFVRGGPEGLAGGAARRLYAEAHPDIGVSAPGCAAGAERAPAGYIHGVVVPDA